MPEPERTIAASTKSRFEKKLYAFVTPEGTIRPIAKKVKGLEVICLKLIIEYPTYGEELEQKRRVYKEDENTGRAFWDQDLLTELRVRRSLIQWNLQEFPFLNVSKILRVQNQMVDASMEQWQNLAPLLRKHIANSINMELGDV